MKIPLPTRVKIVTFENSHVHFDTHLNNYTLCGLETGGDSKLGIKIAMPVKRKVNCPQCIRIVEFCNFINKNEYEKPKRNQVGTKE
jgi:hypothetical protein